MRHWLATAGDKPVSCKKEPFCLCPLASFLFKNVFSAFVVSAQRYSEALNLPDTIPDASTNMFVLVGR
jgi:hypothetical protein